MPWSWSTVSCVSVQTCINSLEAFSSKVHWARISRCWVRGSLKPVAKGQCWRPRTIGELTATPQASAPSLHPIFAPRLSLDTSLLLLQKRGQFCRMQTCAGWVWPRLPACSWGVWAGGFLLCLLSSLALCCVHLSLVPSPIFLLLAATLQVSSGELLRPTSQSTSDLLDLATPEGPLHSQAVWANGALSAKPTLSWIFPPVFN